MFPQTKINSTKGLKTVAKTSQRKHSYLYSDTMKLQFKKWKRSKFVSWNNLITIRNRCNFVYTQLRKLYEVRFTALKWDQFASSQEQEASSQ